METTSTNTVLKRNLFALMIWEGAYQERQEVTNFRFNGGVNGMGSTALTMLDNVVAGSERVGYHVPPLACGSASR